MVFHYLYTAIYSGYYVKQDWQLWVDKLIVKSKEVENWMLELSIANSMSDALLAIAFEKNTEEIKKDLYYWEPDIIMGYYFIMYQEKKIDFHTLITKLYDEDDAVSESMLFDLRAFNECLDKMSKMEMITDKFSQFIVPYCSQAKYQIEYLSKYNNDI